MCGVNGNKDKNKIDIVNIYRNMSFYRKHFVEQQFLVYAFPVSHRALSLLKVMRWVLYCETFKSNIESFSLRQTITSQQVQQARVEFHSLFFVADNVFLWKSITRIFLVKFEVNFCQHLMHKALYENFIISCGFLENFSCNIVTWHAVILILNTL